MDLLETLVEEDYGIEGSGKWLRSKEHDSLVIDCERQLFYWNSRDLRGDAYIYLTKVRNLPHNEAKELLKTRGFSATFVQHIESGTETIVYPKLVEVFHQNLLEGDRTYFYNRTLTDTTIDRFELGYYNGFYMIPIFQDGTLKQFQMRRDSPKLIKNYYKNVGVLLFNSSILKLTNKIFITEGIIGAMLLAQHGIPAVSMNTGCDSFSPEWIKYFTRQENIYILFDNDKAGDFGAIRTAKILGEFRTKIYNFWDYDGKGFAIDDFFIEGNTKETLFDLVENKSKHTFELQPEKVFHHASKDSYKSSVRHYD